MRSPALATASSRRSTDGAASPSPGSSAASDSNAAWTSDRSPMNGLGRAAVNEVANRAHSTSATVTAASPLSIAAPSAAVQSAGGIGFRPRLRR